MTARYINLHFAYLLYLLTKIVTEIAHVTRDSDTTLKVKRSKVKVTRPLYSAQP